jgi:hypothetical protein
MNLARLNEIADILAMGPALSDQMRLDLADEIREMVAQATIDDGTV